MARSRTSVPGTVLAVALALSSAGLGQLSARATPERSAEPSAAAGASVAVVTALEELLAQVTVTHEGPRDGYERSSFRHWSDLDGDGCDTRQEVLAVERREGRRSGCAVVGGRWYSTYDGVSVRSPRALQIDHMVPLAEAWDSGAAAWDAERRQRFANDLGYDHALVAVTASSNGSKADSDPGEWKPTRRAAWCRYAVAWTTVKIRWSLTADSRELTALREMLGTCRRPPATEVALAPG